MAKLFYNKFKLKLRREQITHFASRLRYEVCSAALPGSSLSLRHRSCRTRSRRHYTHASSKHALRSYEKHMLLTEARSRMWPI